MAAAGLAVPRRRRRAIARVRHARLHRRTSRGSWRATWWRRAIARCPPMSRGSQAPHPRHARRNRLRRPHEARARRPSDTCRAQGGTPEASVLTTSIRTSAVNAALANGMFGHADETDDFEPVTKAHPGCAVRAGGARDGRARRAFGDGGGPRRRSWLRPLLPISDGSRPGPCAREHIEARKARAPRSVRPPPRRRWPGSTNEGCATRCRTRRSRCRASGAGLATASTSRKPSTSAAWVRATVSAAALMVQSGFTGVDEVLDGEHNMIDALSTEPRPEQMMAGLGSRFFVTETAIKTFSVGYPIQAPLDALLTLRRQHGLTADNVDAHRRPASRGRCTHRQRQRDAGRQLSVHPCGRR